MTGLKFKAIRKALCLTQMEFAHMCGYAWSTDVSKYERGKKTSRGAIDTLVETMTMLYALRCKRNKMLPICVAVLYRELARGTDEDTIAVKELETFNK